MLSVYRTPISFRASLNRVILQYLYLPGSHRVQNIYDRVLALSETETAELLGEVNTNFRHRHKKLHETFLRNFERSYRQIDEKRDISETQKLLLGAYFSKEYSTQSAALFNPSIVRHPDQRGVEDGHLRFIMSLRATGEGHISSIEFRTGHVAADGTIEMDPLSPTATCSEKKPDYEYSKDFLKKSLSFYQGVDLSILENFPEKFIAQDAEKFLEGILQSFDFEPTRNAILEIIDTNYQVITDETEHYSEKVIFPNAKGESMGMEDVRFVLFQDEGASKYYGTYTAYDGKSIKTQMIETTDFICFEVKTLYGNAIKDKGMALFPEKINGKYVMISRQGGENISIMYSEDLYFWDTYEPLLSPEYKWEFTQMGNCGSPIKTERGWLLLTHAVGPMRRYVISAALLDLENPSRVIARLNKPLIEPLESEREGYVPNVVYTCGWLAHNDKLIIPYAMSDTNCGVIWISKTELLNELLTLVRNN